MGDLKYENYYEFTNNEYYFNFILSDNDLTPKQNPNLNNNDIRDNLYFIDLDWVKKIDINNLEKNINNFSQFLKNDN